MIKAIAVDMDGTFLNSEGTYDKDLFKDVFSYLKSQNIKFIVASGNQYYQLRSFFPGEDKYISYIAENGAIYADYNHITTVAEFDEQLLMNILDELSKHNIEFVLCGVNSAYILSNSNDAFKSDMSKYYYELKEVDHLKDLPEDKFVKLALSVYDNGHEFRDLLNKKYGDQIVAVSSGHHNIDIILKGVNKGSTLNNLLKELGLTREELMAFGDAGNDKEMLELANYSYAMKNASEDIKSITKEIAPSNDENGVLLTIKKALNI
ncbi:Cof-type HAD-IIB family hydrolase [Mammaliicoccus sciuri]|uniref:Cof-type HAD-IIB family hydrolase n=1 Tax=Mammaliicoccus sciuri TaxID=1296 RepID=UPI0037954F33